MNEKNILLAARVVSLLFTPYYLPVVGLIALFTFSYLSMLPRGYQLTMLLIVYLSTVLFCSLPIVSIRDGGPSSLAIRSDGSSPMSSRSFAIFSAII